MGDVLWRGLTPQKILTITPGAVGAPIDVTQLSEIVVDDAAGTVDVRWVDNDAADGAPNEYPARLKFDKTSKKLSLTLGVGASPTMTSLEITDVDMATVAMLGDGAMKAAVADHLQTLYTALKSMIDAHTHLAGSLVAPPGGGPVTGATGAPPSPAPAWDSKIASTHLLIPTQT